MVAEIGECAEQKEWEAGGLCSLVSMVTSDDRMGHYSGQHVHYNKLLVLLDHIFEASIHFIKFKGEYQTAFWRCMYSE